MWQAPPLYKLGVRYCVFSSGMLQVTLASKHNAIHTDEASTQPGALDRIAMAPVTLGALTLAGATLVA